MEEHSIEALGMRLANRAYLYRLFHVVFGAEPSCEELRVLGSKESDDALNFACEASLADGAEVLSNTREMLASLAQRADDADLLELLESDYSRLFLVPGASYVHPWESPYIGKETMLFQESTLDVRHRYAEYGFVAAEFGHFPEDHVSMMLDFLAHLSTRAFDAFADGEDDEAQQILTSQKDFVKTHLLNWLSEFHGALCEKDETGIYCQLAGALRAFLVLDARFMERALVELDSMEQCQ